MDITFSCTKNISKHSLQFAAVCSHYIVILNSQQQWDMNWTPTGFIILVWLLGVQCTWKCATTPYFQC